MPDRDPGGPSVGLLRGLADALARAQATQVELDAAAVAASREAASLRTAVRGFDAEDGTGARLARLDRRLARLAAAERRSLARAGRARRIGIAWRGWTAALRAASEQRRSARLARRAARPARRRLAAWEAALRALVIDLRRGLRVALIPAAGGAAPGLGDPPGGPPGPTEAEGAGPAPPSTAAAPGRTGGGPSPDAADPWADLLRRLRPARDEEPVAAEDAQAPWRELLERPRTPGVGDEGEDD